jgi:hypothetical protein
MIWGILAIYFLVGDVISRYYVRRMKSKYIIIGRKESEAFALEELFIFFLWLPFLFFLAIALLIEKAKDIRKRMVFRKKIKKANLRKFCQGPMGLCDSVNYDCSQCPSINQIMALEKIYKK